MMDSASLLKSLELIFQNVLEDDEFVIREDMTVDTVDGWTSLTMAQIVSSIEKKYNIKFTLSDLLSVNGVAQLISIIESKA